VRKRLFSKCQQPFSLGKLPQLLLPQLLLPQLLLPQLLLLQLLLLQPLLLQLLLLQQASRNALYPPSVF